jgi:2-dehydro-3-deoxy-D-gluconate 5-dehydrogenase
MGLTRLMANELAQHHINVNAIAPGYMATENTRAIGEDLKRNAEILVRIPAGRWGKAEDLQGAVVFLASNASN